MSNGGPKDGRGGGQGMPGGGRGAPTPGAAPREARVVDKVVDRVRGLAAKDNF